MTANFMARLMGHMRGLTVVNAARSSAVRDTLPIAIGLLQRGLVDFQTLVHLDAYPQLLADAIATSGLQGSRQTGGVIRRS